MQLNLDRISEALPVVCGITLPCLIAFVSAYVGLRFRSIEYSREHADRATERAERTVPDAAAPKVFLDFAPLVAPEHANSIKAQNYYYSSVVKLFSGLFMAFLCAALSATVLRGSEMAKTFIGWAELGSLCLALLELRRGEIANRRWLAQRTLTELLRQYRFLQALFSSGFESDDPGGAFYKERGRITDSVLKTDDVNKLAERIYVFWRGRRAAYQILPGRCENQELSFYIERRVEPQLDWFRSAQARLISGERERKKSLTILFGVSVVLAITELVLHYIGQPGSEFPNVIILFLLAATGASAATMGIYLSQNRRSLVQQYNAQLRRIENWIVRARELSQEGRVLGISTSNRDCKVREYVLEFETLMIDELVDWVCITGRDKLELSA